MKQASLAAAAGRSTTQMSDILNGRIRRAPDWEVVEAVVGACLAHAEQASRLVPPDLGDLEDWRRRYFDLEQDLDARTRPGAEGTAAAVPSSAMAAQPEEALGPLGIPLAEVKNPDAATHFGVKESIITGTAAGGGLTPYIRRDLDEQLESVVEQVIRGGPSRVAVLVGDSSTGKTRACWEALARIPNDWRLWHPHDEKQLLAGLRPASDGRGITGPLLPRTVVWLDELHRYLSPDSAAPKEAAVALLTLLADQRHGPVLVLGTIWPDRWNVLVASPGNGPDPYAQARSLLLNKEIVVPETVTDAELDKADPRDKEDPRWQLAMTQDRTRPIQFLAGVPFLRKRYENGTAAVRAVLDATGDARRVGAPYRLPLAFLEKAAQNYLSNADWDALPRSQRQTWVRDVIEQELSRGEHGVGAPLHPPRDAPPGAEVAYVLEDYLEQFLRRSLATTQPRNSLWSAACAFTDPAILTAIARSAYDRGRYIPAADLYAHAVRAGNTGALTALAELKLAAGDRDAGLQDLYAASMKGETRARRCVVLLLEESGNPDKAEELVDQALAAGDTAPAMDLAAARADADETEEAERLYLKARAAGDSSAAHDLASLRITKDPAVSVRRHFEIVRGNLDPMSFFHYSQRVKRRSDPYFNFVGDDDYRGPRPWQEFHLEDLDEFQKLPDRIKERFARDPGSPLYHAPGLDHGIAKVV